MNVCIESLPAFFRDVPKRLWPLPKPLFPLGPPTDDDRDLARALWRELDEQSRAWYLRGSPWLAE